jgi:hypothetical protein
MSNVWAFGWVANLFLLSIFELISNHITLKHVVAVVSLGGITIMAFPNERRISCMIAMVYWGLGIYMVIAFVHDIARCCISFGIFLISIYGLEKYLKDNIDQESL